MKPKPNLMCVCVTEKGNETKTKSNVCLCDRKRYIWNWFSVCFSCTTSQVGISPGIFYWIEKMLKGRKRDSIWHHFNEVGCEERKGKRAKCKQCGKEMEGQVKRMKAHAGVCMNNGGTETDFDDPDGPGTSGISKPQGQSGEQVEVLSTGGTSHEKLHVVKPKNTDVKSVQKKTSSTTLADFVVKTSTVQKQTLDEQVAKFIFANNSAFRTVENPEFIKMVEMLRPGYKPPSRIAISNELLDSVYLKEKNKCMDGLSGNIVSLSLDGWSNIHNDPIVCTSIITEEGKSVLVETVDTSGNSHTAEYLLQLVQSSIQNLKREHEIEVGSVVTDNTGNVKKMRELLSKQHDTENILTYGCSAHLINLLMHDVQVEGIKENLLVVVKYFRNNHFASAKYKETGKAKLVLPNDTRWNSFVDCIEVYLSSWPTLKSICEENKNDINENVRKLVLNMGLKRNTEDLLMIMKPMAVALDRLQRSFSTIADSAQAFKILQEDLENLPFEAPSSTIKNFKKRKDQALTGAHYLANLLHPVYRGLKLSVEEMESAMTYASEISERENCTSFTPTLVKYKAQSGPFLKILFKNNVVKEVTALHWWQSLRNELDQDVLKLVTKLLGASSSTAALERFFSTFGIVQSELRNRLGNQKASKLVFVLRSLNNK